MPKKEGAAEGEPEEDVIHTLEAVKSEPDAVVHPRPRRPQIALVGARSPGNERSTLLFRTTFDADGPTVL